MADNPNDRNDHLLSAFHYAPIVDAFTTKLIPQSKENEHLENAATRAQEAGIPSIAVSSAQGQFLSILCKTTSAKNILEIGTLGGYSTLWLAGSSPEAKVTSLEISPHHKKVALESVNLAGKGDQVDVILGPALESLPKLASEVKQGQRPLFDFAFIDGAWEEQTQYFEHVVTIVRKGGCIFIDNIIRTLLEFGAVPGGPEASEDVPGYVDVVTAVSKDSRVDAVVVPTACAHALGTAYDGFLMAYVK